MEQNHLVSVIIPSYKRSNTVLRAIRSVLSQTYDNFEVIVVDDNLKGDEYSKGLTQLVKSVLDKRVQLLTQEKHINGAEARNAGVRASKGKYIAFLDDDDEWEPDKIEKQIMFLENHPELKGCSTFYNEFKNGVLVHSCPPYTQENIFYKIFRREVAVFTSTVLLEKKCFIESGMFDNQLTRHQDLQMLLSFTNKFELGVCPEYLVRLHLDSDINRPNAKKIVEVKENFFKSVSNLYLNCPSKEKSLIKSSHFYEIFFAALKQKEFMMALKYFLNAGFSFRGYKLLYKRFKDRKFKMK